MDPADQLTEPPPAEHALAAAGDARSYTREDGTLVIDILAAPPCGESAPDEIVVCAPEESDQGIEHLDPPPEEPATLGAQLAPNLAAGTRTEAGQDGEVRVMIDLKLKF